MESNSKTTQPKRECNIAFFDSHAEADEANAEFYRSLSGDERIKIALQIMAPTYAAFPRFERVLRFVELGECPVSRDRWMGVQPVR